MTSFLSMMYSFGYIVSKLLPLINEEFLENNVLCGSLGLRKLFDIITHCDNNLLHY